MKRTERLKRERALVSAGADRIELTWHRALRAGVPGGWYPETRDAILDRTFRFTDRHGLPDYVGIEIASVLSPRIPWDGAPFSVLGMLPDVLRNPWDALQPFLPFGREATWRLLAGEPWDAVVPPGTAPKVRAFRACLLGARNAVVVDTWSARIVGIMPRKVRQYRLAQRAYRLAAKRIGADPADVQARTWVAVRERGIEIPGGVA